jgi:hypothetical protein
LAQIHAGGEWLAGVFRVRALDRTQAGRSLHELRSRIFVITEPRIELAARSNVRLVIGFPSSSPGLGQRYRRFLPAI